MSNRVHNNLSNQQFEISFENELASMVYRIHDNKMYLMHTSVPEKLKGKGFASALADFAIEYAKKKELELVAYCPFAKSYLDKKQN